MSLITDGLGIKESFTKMKWLRLLKRMDVVETEFLRSKMKA